jgi:uncharacterized membrane protein
MFDAVYQFLESIGYPHPIHPAETHLPIGTVVAAFFFAWAAFLFRRPRLASTARHCIIFAFIFVFPTMLFGFMDWQHFFAGAWLNPIKIKLTLAAILTVLLFIGILLGSRYGAESKSALTVYTVCFCIVVAIGFFGGQLVYTGWGPEPTKEEFKAGAKIFRANCSGCHPSGGNIVVPSLPLKSAPELANFNSFEGFIRNPKMPDGSRGDMPPFPVKRVSEQKAKELYEYIIHVLEKPRG